jgi:acetoin utilization protein AcuB
MNEESRAVSAWMQRHVHVAHPHDTIEHARELCERHRINQLPVMSGGTLVGIVTDRDLRDAFPSLGEQVTHPERSHRETQSIRVEDVMTANVLTIAADELIEHAAAIMRKERVGALPVLRDDRMVGILTRTDLLNALIALASR